MKSPFNSSVTREFFTLMEMASDELYVNAIDRQVLLVISFLRALWHRTSDFKVISPNSNKLRYEIRRSLNEQLFSRYTTEIENS